MVMESTELKNKYLIFKRHYETFKDFKKVLLKGIKKAPEKNLLKTGFWTIRTGKLCLDMLV